ncbi:MAG: hypothetical protein GFGODING_00455 [Flavobacteriales bacterium]|nr:hypothetical protein [Flavobacteriales bacterium]
MVPFHFWTINVCAMKTLSILRLQCLSALLAAPFAGHAALEYVLITGWLTGPEVDQRESVLSVELEGETCVYTVLETDGYFAFSLPVDARAELFFAKPGHLAKRITVDTRNADSSAKARRVNKNVRFEVVLEEAGSRPALADNRLVGSISFVKGTGLMKVRYYDRACERLALQR